MTERFSPVALWFRRHDKKAEYLIVADPNPDGVIRYSITNMQGTPVGSEYIGASFYRNRPVVARFNWVTLLLDTLDEYGLVLDYKRAENNAILVDD